MKSGRPRSSTVRYSVSYSWYYGTFVLALENLQDAPLRLRATENGDPLVMCQSTMLSPMRGSCKPVESKSLWRKGLLFCAFDSCLPSHWPTSNFLRKIMFFSEDILFIKFLPDFERITLFWAFVKILCQGGGKVFSFERKNFMTKRVLSEKIFFMNFLDSEQKNFKLLEIKLWTSGKKFSTWLWGLDSTPPEGFLRKIGLNCWVNVFKTFSDPRRFFVWTLAKERQQIVKIAFLSV